MATYLGAIKASEMSGRRFVDKEDGTIVLVLDIRKGRDVYKNKNVSIVYYKVVEGRGKRYNHTGVIGHSTLSKFKKEYIEI